MLSFRILYALRGEFVISIVAEKSCLTYALKDPSTTLGMTVEMVYAWLHDTFSSCSLCASW